MKIAVSLCAIGSSGLTLAAYFGGLDFATRPLLHVNSQAGTPVEPGPLTDPEIFPPGLSEFADSPIAAS